MALKSKNEEVIEEPTIEQVSFDDIEFEAEYIDEDLQLQQRSFIIFLI